LKITVKLFASLRTHGENIQDIIIGDSLTVKDVINLMALPKEEVSILMINGIGVNLDTKLKEADVLAIFPLVGGG